MTATRQAAARAHAWSVENLRLHVEVYNGQHIVSPSFIVQGSKSNHYVCREGVQDTHLSPPPLSLVGLTLEGAGWEDGQLAVTSQLFTRMPDMCFTWRHKEDSKLSTTTTTSSAQQQDGLLSVSVPVYVNNRRTEFLFAADISGPARTAKDLWYQRGVALSAWAQDIA